MRISEILKGVRAYVRLRELNLAAPGRRGIVDREGMGDASSGLVRLSATPLPSPPARPSPPSPQLIGSVCHGGDTLMN